MDLNNKRKNFLKIDETLTAIKFIHEDESDKGSYIDNLLNNSNAELVQVMGMQAVYWKRGHRNSDKDKV